MGTVGYMSPEQLRGEVADLRSDVFGFGVVFYEMLTGTSPFARAGRAATLSAVLEEPMPRIESPHGPLSGGLEAIVRRCLQKRAQSRFASARELVRALEALAQRSAIAVAQPPALVVLPFTNLGGDPDDDFFSDGLTDELIADLSRIEDLRVVSGPSAFRFKKTEKPIREIAEELDVDHILVGRVRRSGSQVRLTAELIDAKEDSTVWAEKYRGTLEQAFELQEQISRAIADALAVRLREPARAPRPEASEAYLRGRHYYRQASVTGMKKALEQFERATEIDPEFAPAFAGVADILTWLTAAWTALPAHETMPRARTYVRRALELDPKLPTAHVASGTVATYGDWSLARAESAFREALRLNPDDAWGHFWFAHPLMWLDTRFDDAVSHARTAARLDPVNPWFQLWLAVALYFARDFEAAVEQNREVVTLVPLWGFGHYFLGTTLATMGRLDEARASLERALELDPGSVHVVNWLGCVDALAGRREAAAACLAEVESQREKGLSVAAWKLHLYAAVEDAEGVMNCLEEAYAERSASLVFLLTHPLVDCVRGQTRFEALLRSMDLEHLVRYRPQPAWRPLAEWWR